MNFLLGMVPWILLLSIFLGHWGISSLWERRRRRRHGPGADADVTTSTEAPSETRAR
jgi:hypothetical protein